MRAILLSFLCLGLVGCLAPPPPAPLIPPPSGPPPVACHGVDLASCLAIARDAASALQDDPDPVVLVEVFPEVVALELHDGAGRQQATYTAAQGHPTTFGAWGEVVTGPIEAHSATNAPDSMSITLGHCGLTSPIDVDGSLWDPVGQIPQVGSLINATEGEFRLTGLDDATFVTADAQVSLRRHLGAKSLPGCD